MIASSSQSSSSRQFITLGILGGSLVIVSPVLHSQFEYFGWHVGTVLSALVLSWLIFRLPPRIKVHIRNAYTLLSSVFILIITIGYAGQYVGIGYVDAIINALTNRNIVSGAVTLNGFYSAFIHPSVRWQVIGLTIISTTLINGRTGLLVSIALATLILLQQLLAGKSWRLKAIYFGAMAASGALLIALPVIILHTIDSITLHSGPNLLRSSADLSSSAWNHSHSQLTALRVQSENAPGHYGGSLVYPQRINARPSPHAQYSGIAIIQQVTAAEIGESYVASIYLKSTSGTAPHQSLQLSTNYTKRVCTVLPVWTRCVAPPALVHDQLNLQFQLRFVNEQPFDVLVWGPQLEKGSEPGTVHHTHFSSGLVSLTRQLRRLDVRNLAHDSNVQERIKGYGWSLKRIASSPLIGHGFNRFEEKSSLESAGMLTLNHAHNLILQILFEGGIFRLVGTLLIFVAACLLHRPRPYPLILFILLNSGINLTDVIHYHASVYYSFWIALGLLPSTSEAHPPHVSPTSNSLAENATNG